MQCLTGDNSRRSSWKQKKLKEKFKEIFGKTNVN